MRRSYVVSGILLILHTFDFAVAAPVLAHEKPQAGVDMVHISKDAITTLGKRGGEMDDLLFIISGGAKDRYISPEESLVAKGRLAHADGGTDVKQSAQPLRLPPIPEEPESVSSPDHGSPSPGKPSLVSKL